MMKLLSIDVGIKNLAFCLLDVSAATANDDDGAVINECSILQWGVIDVCRSEQDEAAAAQRAAAHHKCSHSIHKSKSKSNTTTACASNAAFFYYKEDQLHFICKRHANKMRESGNKCEYQGDNHHSQKKVFHFASDTNEVVVAGPLKPAKLLNAGTAEQLFTFCKAHSACEPEWEMAAPRWTGLKSVMRDRARHVMRTRYMHAYDALNEISAILDPVPTGIKSKPMLKAKQHEPEHVSLITVGSNLMIKFDKLFYGPSSDKPDNVIIENQISPIATRMKTVQGMVTQYFLMRGIPPDHISYISATNKLKAWTSVNDDADEIDTYDGRKKMGIACVRKLLSGDDGVARACVGSNDCKKIKFKMSASTALQWRPVFEAHKKKDDMADSLLQGLSYL